MSILLTEEQNEIYSRIVGMANHPSNGNGLKGLGEFPYFIGLSGYARSGKDTVASILIDRFGYKRVAFADGVRELLYKANPIVVFPGSDRVRVQEVVDRLGWDEAKTFPEIRESLQRIGVAVREVLGEEAWIKAAFKKAYETATKGTPYVVFTDVRFPNEADAIRAEAPGNQVWRITRPGVEALNDHASEISMDGYPVDYEILNKGDIAYLTDLIEFWGSANMSII